MDADSTVRVDGKPRRAGVRKRYFLATVPLLVVVLFFAYLWFVSGVLPVLERYPNRQIKTEGYVKRAGFGAYHRQGHWVTYHPNGQKASEGFYENGKKVGRWTYWNEEGRQLSAPPAADLAAAGPK